jgi:hypothetical protein
MGCFLGGGGSLDAAWVLAGQVDVTCYAQSVHLCIQRSAVPHCRRLQIAGGRYKYSDISVKTLSTA